MAIEDRTGASGAGPGDPPAPVEGITRFFEVCLEIGSGPSSTIIGTRAVSEAIADILVENGFDPASFESLSWPTGASRHASIKLLLSGQDYIDLEAALGDWTNFLTLKMGPSEFGPMWVRDSGVVAWTEGSGKVHAIEVVDKRYFWQDENVFRHDDDLVVRAINVTTSDKEVFYQSSLNGSEQYTYVQMLDELMLQIHQPYQTDGLVDKMTNRMESSLGLKDFSVEGRNVGQLIDQIMVLAGHVFIMKPDGTYRVDAIEGGDSDLDLMLSNGAQDAILNAGPACIATTDPSSDKMIDLLTDRFWLARRNPSAVHVLFPTALKGGEGYTFDNNDDSTGKSYVLGQWFRVETTSGKPAGLADNGEIVTVFDPEWAIFQQKSSDPTNLSDLTSRANDVATAYYGRLSSGAGRFRMSAMYEMEYAGASMVRWSIVRYGEDAGIFTDVYGRFDDPIFGHDYDKPLTANEILSIGPVRMLPRPGGGMLADATGKAPQTRIHIARITGVNPKDENGTPTVTGFNATYKAISIATYDTPPAEDDKGNPDPENDTRITVPKDVAQYDIQDTFEPTAWVDPITRPVGDPDKIPLRIDSGPAGLGDLCFIVIDTIPSNGPAPPITFHALMAWEKIDSSPCSSASSSALPPDPLGEAMTMAAMGVI